jgi:hypothetical protein
MRTFKPSRILNEGSKIMGLGAFDIIGLTIFFFMTQILLSIFKLEIFSLFISGAVAVFLIQIRLKYRTGMIRDLARSSMIKIFKRGVFEDGLRSDTSKTA